MSALPANLLDELVEAVAERAAEIVLERMALESQPAPETSLFLSVREAADLIRAKPQRIYDLVSSGRLARHKEGTRVLVRRADLEALVAVEGAPGVAHPLPTISPRRSGRGLAR